MTFDKEVKKNLLVFIAGEDDTSNKTTATNPVLFKFIHFTVRRLKKTLVKCTNTLQKVSTKKKLNVVFYDRKLRTGAFYGAEKACLTE